MRKLLLKLRMWRHWYLGRCTTKEERQLAKIMCLLAALDAPPDVAEDLRRIAREDLSN